MTFVVLAIFAVLMLLVLPMLIGRRHLRIVAPLAICVTAAAIFGLWTATGEKAAWDTATPVGDRVLEVSYVGSECEDHRSVSTKESDESVRITIRTWSFSSACSEVGVLRTVTVELDDDLGSRRLVDGGCGSQSAGCTRSASASGGG